MNIPRCPTICATILIACFFVVPARAQEGLSCDSLFSLARHAAFSDHDHGKAKSLCRQALVKCPDYADIGNFLGRIYTWDHSTDSAAEILLGVLQRHPDNEETLSALTDLEYWNDRPAKALEYCEKGLRFHPGAKELLEKKVRILNDLRRYNAAAAIADSLLKLDPKNDDLRRLATQVRYLAAKNQLGLNYDYVYFDKQFDAPWHLASLDYKRQTPVGPFIGRINYANRFRTNGLQAEVDAYPHISRTFYSYVNAGFSNDVGVFPKYRAGFSLYANLPKSFEAEAGFRYLYFSSSTRIYTISAGKYYKNFWFNLRSYLTPGEGSTSQSYTLTARYYYGGADDYWTLAAGTGISPDDRSNNIQLNDRYPLRTNKLAAGYNHAITKLNVLFITATWLNQEYLPKIHGNQVDVGIGFQKRF